MNGREREGDLELLQQVHRNEVVLTGTALDAPVYSHCNHEARFYQFPMEILRLSGQTDELVVMAPAPLLERAAVARGARVSLSGQLRSYNNKTGQGRRLILTVFAKTLRPGEGEDHNVIFLTGVICKPPVYRSTPLGRSICDVMLAVNRPYGRSDYIPCIAWGALAGEIAALRVGETLSFEGRVQSRLYHKKTPEGMECRVAYEVSVMCLEEKEK